MNLGPHAAFIYAAYGAALVIVTLLAAWIALSYVSLKRQLRVLEQSGVSRRSIPEKIR